MRGVNLVSGDRRTFLRTVSAVAGAAAVAGLPLDHAMAGPGMPRGNPFTLGVASGDPDHRSGVLWTRLVPEALAPDGGMPR